MIADVAASDKVWNLAVREDETYLAENLIVHNCRSSPLEIFSHEDFEETDVPTSVEPDEGFGFNPGELFGVAA